MKELKRQKLIHWLIDLGHISIILMCCISYSLTLKIFIIYYMQENCFYFSYSIIHNSRIRGVYEALRATGQHLGVNICCNGRYCHSTEVGRSCLANEKTNKTKPYHSIQSTDWNQRAPHQSKASIWIVSSQFSNWGLSTVLIWQWEKG